MKTTVNIFLAVVLSLSIAWGQKIETKDFNIKGFSKIKVSNALDVRLIADDSESVHVKCDNRLIPAIKVEKNNNTLEIAFDWDKIREITGRRRNRSISINDNSVKINGMVFKGGIEITAHIKQMNKITTSSSASVKWDGNLPTDNLDIKCSSSGDVLWTGLLDIREVSIDCSSSSDVHGDIKAREIEMELSSSADYTGNIETTNIEVEISSSADFEGTITAEQADFELSSSADFVGTVNVHKASFEMSSSADAKVEGNINLLFVEATSSADFLGKSIVYEKAEVKTSSSGDIYLSKSGEVIDRTPKRSGVFVE